MDEKELRGFIEGVVDYSIGIIPEKGIGARNFESSLKKECFSNYFPNSNEKILDSVYRVFHWNFFCFPDSPLDFIFPQKPWEGSRVFLKEEEFDKQKIVDNIIDRHRYDLVNRIQRSYN